MIRIYFLMNIHSRIFGSDDAKDARSRLTPTKNTLRPVNGLADHIIEVGHGKYLMTDADGIHEMLLNEEELYFILDNSVPQDKAPRSSNVSAGASCAASSSRRRTASPLTSSGRGRSPTSNQHNTNSYKSHPQSHSGRNSDSFPKNSGSVDKSVRRSISPKQIMFRKQPVSSVEKLLALHTTEVLFTLTDTSPGGAGSSSSASPPDCSICLTGTSEESPYNSEKDVSRDLVGCVALKLCGHHFHTSCLMQMASHDTSCLTCPNCQTIHGVRMGTQPRGGNMTVHPSNTSLPGYPGCKTIQITYTFSRGSQGPEHPNPGRPYQLVGFPRVAFLPDNLKGKKVLNLLQVAFNRRLIFTVGTSATSGSPDCVVWNGIHHKTETSNHGGHGYPDPKYLDNVLMELASFGVTE